MPLDRIDSASTPSIQRFYTQRPLPAKTAAPEQKPSASVAAEPALYEFEPLQAPIREPIRESGRESQQGPSQSRNGVVDPTAPPYEEIQSIAKRAGYVGLTERDIKRAYVLGESLLADYRV